MRKVGARLAGAGTPIKEIVIVGGGTAGWMSAVYLNRAFGTDVQITLIESKSVDTIGVGEATFSTIKFFFDYVGLNEQEWMPECNATYKLAIKFVDWTSSGGHFYHPFEQYERIRGFGLPEWWLKTRRDTEQFDYACFTVPHLCDTYRSPRFSDGRVFDQRSQFPDLYAYHFDAALLAQFLQKVGVARGVKHIYNDVTGVTLDDGGKIDSVRLAQGWPLRADLFIDCTGFRGLLINEALQEPFLSFSKSLFCDSAVAMRIPTDKREDIEPYTTATALSAGWVWNIPLYERIGTGYVYSSRFIGKEAAEAEFRSFLGPKSADIDALHIKMRVGRDRNPWVKNCVGIGLSCGFVEPLESTGIFFIHFALDELVNQCSDMCFDEAAIKNFNKAVGRCIDGVRDFLILHYYAGDRVDTAFWRAVKFDIEIPEDLRERLRVWKKRLPNPDNVNPQIHGFAPDSYCVMLLGLNYEPETSLPMLDFIGDQGVEETFAAVKERARRLTETLPSHREYLAWMYPDGSAHT